MNASTNNQIGVYIELDRQHTFLVFNGRIDDLVVSLLFLVKCNN